MACADAQAIYTLMFLPFDESAYLLLAVLQGVKLIVPSMLRQQLLVVALLQFLPWDSTMILFCVLDRGQPVRHDQHSAHRAHLFQRVLDRVSRSRYQCWPLLRPGYHDARLMQQGAGKAEQLPLTGREVVAPLPYFLIQAMIQLGDELILR